VSVTADLDAEIAQRVRELAILKQRRRALDDQAFMLAILEVRDDWFTASELCTLAPLAPWLAAHLGRASSKSLGRRLKQIADDQDRAGTLPPLRLLRHKTTTAPTVWKIETYLPACSLNDRGR